MAMYLVVKNPETGEGAGLPFYIKATKKTIVDKIRSGFNNNPGVYNYYRITLAGSVQVPRVQAPEGE